VVALVDILSYRLRNPRMSHSLFLEQLRKTSAKACSLLARFAHSAWVKAARLGSYDDHATARADKSLVPSPYHQWHENDGIPARA
jgi:hypothetical protein